MSSKDSMGPGAASAPSSVSISRFRRVRTSDTIFSLIASTRRLGCHLGGGTKVPPLSWREGGGASGARSSPPQPPPCLPVPPLPRQQQRQQQEEKAE